LGGLDGFRFALTFLFYESLETSRLPRLVKIGESTLVIRGKAHWKAGAAFSRFTITATAFHLSPRRCSPTFLLKFVLVCVVLAKLHPCWRVPEVAFSRARLSASHVDPPMNRSFVSATLYSHVAVFHLHCSRSLE
jgi:hypothetical protein